MVGTRRDRRRAPVPSGSAAAYEIDDLDPVARGEAPLREAAARHDLLVDLDGDAALADSERVQEIRDAHRVVDVVRLAVDGQNHASTLAARVRLYNCDLLRYPCAL